MGIRFCPAAALLVVLTSTTIVGQPANESYTPKDGRYTVKFAGKPKEQSQTIKTDIGNLKVVVATYAAADGKTAWVSYTDYPADAIKPDVRSKLIDATRDGLKGTDGKLVGEKDIEFGPSKLPGREVVVDRGKYQIRCRFLIRDARLYQLAVLGPGEFVTGKDATAFLDSFEIK